MTEMRPPAHVMHPPASCYSLLALLDTGPLRTPFAACEAAPLHGVMTLNKARYPLDGFAQAILRFVGKDEADVLVPKGIAAPGDHRRRRDFLFG